MDLPAIEHLVTYLLDSGVSGLFILGSSGEGPWLTASQRQQVIEQTAGAAGGHVPVLVGVLEPGTRRTLEAVQMAEDAGADAVVMTSPYYFPADAAIQIHHFETIAAASALPVMLYNVPANTHNPISPDTVGRLLGIDNLVAIKDSAGNWQDFERLLELRASKPGLRVFQGHESLAARSVLAGADGIVPGLGNLVPGLFVRLVASARAGDREMAFSLQAQVDALCELYTLGSWLACLKYAASLLDFGSGVTSGPTDCLSEPARATIRQLVQTYVTSVA